ncbi:MAG TPA: pyruvate dehydrogenase (acetyl-transferring) E1 component subunit alpha, partial [Candidatus Cloacimonas sp.]|nr:pyruvate dehydrogenase (acetyl-transferring) E1 component subunit alpha [Candidatus Cloacimonas sp.]
IHIAAGMVTQEQDWLVPAFRELGAWLAKGVSLREIFLYFKGQEDGSRFEKAKRMLPVSVPIASQLVHAAGLGYAINYNKEKDTAVFAYVGDGGTSEGDFHEAMNFAAVWNAPVVFIVQNNQFAISVPLAMQTKS